MDMETLSESESNDEPSDDSSEDEELSNVPDTNAEQEIEGDFEYVIWNLSFIS